MKILHVGPIISGYADGPSRSVLGLAKGQARIGHDVAVLPSEPPGAGQAIVSEEIKILPAPRKKHLNPFWVPESWGDLIEQEFGTPDIVHFHDFYIPFQFALAKYCVKKKWNYITSPRGSLMPLAQTRGAIKKKVANFLFAKTFLENAAAVHALCKNESEGIKHLMPEVDICYMR